MLLVPPRTVPAIGSNSLCVCVCVCLYKSIAEFLKCFSSSVFPTDRATLGGEVGKRFFDHCSRFCSGNDEKKVDQPATGPCYGAHCLRLRGSTSATERVPCSPRSAPKK